VELALREGDLAQRRRRLRRRGDARRQEAREEDLILIPSMQGVGARVAEYPFWYHKLDLGDGLSTDGMWDLAPVASQLPWPDVRGKRCLDVGTFDGFYAFEMERRGAAEVVAVDIAGWDQADLSFDMRGEVPWQKRFEGTPWRHGGGFALAREALGSRVDWQPVSIYDLSPERVGTFDVVTCGSLLLHLRDPIRALEAVRTVCQGGHFLSVETIDPYLTALCRGLPVARFRGRGHLSQWWNINSAGHVAWLESGGVEIAAGAQPIIVPPPYAELHKKPGLRGVAHRGLVRALARTRTARGALHRAALCRPLPDHTYVV
jgi:tRNA (mo5U34)-methyltransferase